MTENYPKFVRVVNDLIDHLDFVEQQMRLIESDGESGLEIHEMADLERYAHTAECLSKAYCQLARFTKPN